MDAPATGLRLRLRQKAVRPSARPSRPAGARAFPRGPGLPEQAGPLPGESRRAACRADVSTGNSRSRRRYHLLVAGAAILSPGTVRRANETDFTSSLPRPQRTCEPATGLLLRPASDRAASVGRA